MLVKTLPSRNAGGNYKYIDLYKLALMPIFSIMCVCEKNEPGQFREVNFGSFESGGNSVSKISYCSGRIVHPKNKQGK